jgi:hypothetical protein
MLSSCKVYLKKTQPPFINTWHSLDLHKKNTQTMNPHEGKKKGAIEKTLTFIPSLPIANQTSKGLFKAWNPLVQNLIKH